MAGEGLRERKKRETRIALSWAAIRLAVERGFDNVRVEDIAAEVGVSPRTFNNYFSSKADAIVARHVERWRLIATELRARPPSEPLWQAITHSVLTRFTLGKSGDQPPDQQWQTGLRLVLEEPALRAEFARANFAAEFELAKAIAERTGTDPERELYPRLVAGTVGVAVRVATERYLGADPPSAMEALRDALRQVAAGLPVP